MNEYTIAGIKAAEFGIYFCDKTGSIIDNEQLNGFKNNPKRSLHITEMTDPEKYKELIVKKIQLQNEFQTFIKEQAGLFPIPCLGGTIDGEIYPEVKL
jgi:hypothetical protein